MAEHCLECFHKVNGTQYKEKAVSLEEGFCESCGAVKPCVVRLYPQPWWRLAVWRSERLGREGK